MYMYVYVYTYMWRRRGSSSTVGIDVKGSSDSNHKPTVGIVSRAEKGFRSNSRPVVKVTRVLRDGNR